MSFSAWNFGGDRSEPFWFPLETILRAEEGGSLLLPGERLTADLDPFLHARTLPDGIGGVAREADPDAPATFLLGLLQRQMRQLLVSFVNGHDQGFDGRPPRRDGRIARYTLRLDEMAALARALRELGVGGLGPFEGALADLAAEPGDPVAEAVAVLIGRYYGLFDRLVQTIRPAVRRAAVKLPPALNPKRYLSKDADYRRPVVELAGWLRETVGWAFDHVSVFGSLATLDYVRGASDLDLFGILRRSVAADPEQLLALRAAMRGLWRYLYTVDPLQHHGILLFAEQDMGFYPQVDFPFVLLEYAQTLCGAASERRIFQERDTAFERRHACLAIRQYFRRSVVQGIEPTAFHYKLFVNTLLLFPAFALQLDGTYRYKKHTFEPALRLLGREDAGTLARSMAVWRDNHYGNRIRWTGDEDPLEFHERARGEPVAPGLLEFLGDRYPARALEMAEALEARVSGKAGWRDRMAEGAVEGCAWVEPPQAHTLDEYDACRDGLALCLRKALPGADLVPFGGVGHPGISDIDVIVAVDDDVPDLAPLEPLRNAPEGLDVAFPHLLFHPPSMIVRRSDLPSLGRLYPIFRLPAGPGRPDHDFAGPRDATFHLLSLAEMACHYFWTWGRGALISRRINMRLLLLTLSGFKHSCRCLRLAGTDHPSWGRFEAAIDGLRADWFTLSPREQRRRLFRILLDSMAFQGMILEALAQRIGGLVDAREALPADLAPGTLVAVLYRNHYFTAGWDMADALRTGMLREATTPERTLVLPAELAALLAYYTRFDTPLGRFLRVHLTHRFDVARIRVAPEVEERRRMVEAHLEWLGARGATWGQLPHWPMNPARPDAEMAGMTPERLVPNLLATTSLWFGMDEALAGIDRAKAERAAVEALYGQGDFEAVIGRIEKGGPILQADPGLMFFLSLASFKAGREAAFCIATMDRALALGADRFWALYQRGCMKASRGDADGAIADLRDADAINPGSAVVGDLLRTLGAAPCPA